MDWNKFKNWLIVNGAEILPVTNEHERIRFKGQQVGVIYFSGKTSNKYTSNAITCFKNRRKWNGQPISTGRKNTYKKQKKQLLIRDGDECFYCGKPLKEDITLEHIISLTKGGSNNLGNMVLAHEKCNNDAGNMTVKQKMEFAFSKRKQLNKKRN